MKIIEVNNISYKIKDRFLLNDISFSLEEGGFYCVVGMNGSGKTTLIKSLTNNIVLNDGQIKIKDKDIRKYSAKQLAHNISVVFQENETMFDFSAMQIVFMGRIPYQKLLEQDSEEDFLIVKDCMERTNTWHLRNRNIKDLSGGEKQRVFIARCLAQKTPIILLDEPVSSLDIKHQFEIMELLKKINKESNTTILIILHDLSLTLKYADYVIALKDGRLVNFGSNKDVLTADNIRDIFEVKANIIDNQIFLSNN